MTQHLLEWLTLLTRWFHFTAGIAWIGASFYFVWVENALERGEQRAEGIAGHLWALHGGGFYYLEKYKTAPASLPPTIHWFKWEAYSTWLSGMLLMALIYYANAQAWLIAPDSGLSPLAGVAISVASLLAGLAAYIGLCSTPLLRRPVMLAVVGLVLSILYLYLIRDIFTPRASMIHLGAVIGTIMAANVLLVIIPGQRMLVDMVETGKEPEREMVHRGMLRSTHNNYLTLPVLFMMISSHHPGTYTGDYWLATITLLMVGSVLLRHFFNLKNKGVWRWGWLGSSAAVLSFAMLTSYQDLAGFGTGGDDVPFDQVRAVLDEHCVSCHSANPTDEIFTFAPLGFIIDTDEQINARALDIHQRTVVDRTMPLANQSGMTEEERELIAAWFASLQSKQ